MKQLAKRANIIKPSATVALTTRAKLLKKEGKDIIIMAAGEPDFDTPDYIKEYAIDAIQKGFTKYTPAEGTVELRMAIAEKLKRDNNLEYDWKDIVVSNGAKQAIANTLMVIIDEGDEVIIPSPYWVTYTSLVELVGGKPVIVKTKIENEFKLTPEELEKHITPKTKAIILNSPSNPTGSVYTLEELKALGEIIEKHDLFVISDEIYEKIIYDGYKHISIASISDKLKENTIIINGVSKSHAMTGWRVGFSASNSEIAKKIAALQSQLSHHTASISQKAAEIAFLKNDGSVEKMRKEFEKRRDKIVEMLSNIEGIKFNIPHGAFYVFPDVSYFYRKRYKNWYIKNSLDLSEFLLEKVGLAAVSGIAFGEDSCIRFSYATNIDNIIEGINRFKKALEMLL